jgi:ferric-dicitrate binding protein FerR (iron transport regulator)
MANNNNILPPNDPDLILAKRIGNSLPDLHTLDPEEDPLLNELFNYKRSVEADVKDTIDSNAIWDTIENSIIDSGSVKSKSRILNFSPAIKRFAIAASILIAAIVGSYMFQQQTQPTLIGESFATISRVTLTDGSSVSLRPYSRIYLVDEHEGEMSYKLEGEAYFDVISNPQRIFSVKTGQSKVQVLGTKFILSAWGNSSDVYLEEGRISFESLNSGSSVVLEPGQSSRINNTTSTPVVSQKDPQIFTDWLNNELIFDNDRVRDIFNELEQHFNIRIQSSESIENETLSGSIELGQIDAVLRDFELVLGGSFTKIDGNSYEFNTDS